MGFEVLNEDLEWEVRRIAAAFRMHKYKSAIEVNGYNCKLFLEGEFSVEISAFSGKIDSMSVSGEHLNGCCELFQDFPDPYWNVIGEERTSCNLMAHALYRLGCENEDVFADLKCPLSMHDKMEARLNFPHEFWPLSMHDKMEARLNFPHEFWPQKWLYEEGGTNWTEVE